MRLHEYTEAALGGTEAAPMPAGAVQREYERPKGVRKAREEPAKGPAGESGELRELKRRVAGLESREKLMQQLLVGMSKQLKALQPPPRAALPPSKRQKALKELGANM